MRSASGIKQTRKLYQYSGFGRRTGSSTFPKHTQLLFAERGMVMFASCRAAFADRRWSVPE